VTTSKRRVVLNEYGTAVCLSQFLFRLSDIQSDEHLQEGDQIEV